MGNMNIDIINPVINLYHSNKAVHTNCATKITFTISTTPNASLTIQIKDVTLGSSNVSISNGDIKTELPSGTHTFTVVNSTVYVTIILGNVPIDAHSSNLVFLEITDNTNNVYKEVGFGRSVKGICGEETPDEPAPPTNPNEPVINPVPQAPTVNCRVHFTGATLNDVTSKTIFSDSIAFTKIYEVDKFSEYVGSGEYPDNEVAFPKSIATTFDSVAIDANTRLVVYKDKNFNGPILLDITGPKLIFNHIFENDPEGYGEGYHKTFSEPLQSNYPQSVRIWSSTNMHDWKTGSIKITCL